MSIRTWKNTFKCKYNYLEEKKKTTDSRPDHPNPANARGASLPEEAFPKWRHPHGLLTPKPAGCEERLKLEEDACQTWDLSREHQRSKYFQVQVMMYKRRDSTFKHHPSQIVV